MPVCVWWVRVVRTVGGVCFASEVGVRSWVVVVPGVRDEVSGIAAGRGGVGGVL